MSLVLIRVHTYNDVSLYSFCCQVPPKGHLQMPVEFKSRFLRPCSGTLVLVGKREGSPCGNTLVFSLDTCITNIVPVVRKDMLPANELDDSV